MISYAYVGMLLTALIFGILMGKLPEVSAGAMEGAASAIQISLTLAGPLCLWSGVGELLRRSGLRDRLGCLLRPVLVRLFPGTKDKPEALSALSANVTANFLGLGNAATPMGVAACGAMGDGSGRPTRDQCRLIVLNTASIQLLPTTVAALRASLGAKNPMDILPAVLLTSLCSVTGGLLACRLMEGRRA